MLSEGFEETIVKASLSGISGQISKYFARTSLSNIESSKPLSLADSTVFSKASATTAISASVIFSVGTIVIVNAIDFLPFPKSNASNTTTSVICESLDTAAPVNFSAGISASTINAKSRVIG